MVKGERNQMGKMNKQFFIGKWRVARMKVRGKKRNEAVTGGCSTWNLWLLNGGVGVGAEGGSGCRIGEWVLKVVTLIAWNDIHIYPKLKHTYIYYIEN